jgi:hypothetical protein
MNRTRAFPGLRLLLAVAALAALGLCAGAAVPGPASADDDDDGDNGGGTYQICSGDTTGSGTSGGVTTQICTITPADGTSETCYQRSDEPIVVQRCTFTQASSMSNLRLTATQIHDPEGGPNGVQDATQVIEGTQTNTGTNNWRNSNYLKATQIAAQCLGHGDPHEDDDDDWNDEDDDGDFDDDGRCEAGDEEDGDDEEDDEDDNRLRLLLLTSTSLPATITQDQEAHQTIDARQSTVARGKNETYAFQTEDLHQRAANAGTITQLQNTDAARANECGEFATGLADTLNANSCFSIVQDSLHGLNRTELEQEYKLFQSARKATVGGTQIQGPPNEEEGGLEHSFELNGSNIDVANSRQESDQVELLTQRRSNVPAGFAWNHHGGNRKGFGMLDGNADIFQDTVLKSTGPGVGNQHAFLQISCQSTAGNCRGFQHAETNDSEATNGPFSSPFLFMTIVCEEPESEIDSITILQTGAVCEPEID